VSKSAAPPMASAVRFNEEDVFIGITLFPRTGEEKRVNNDEVRIGRAFSACCV
jgi:hypothetical protein